MWSLNLIFNRLLIGFVERFQSLEILQQNIDINAESEDQIEDPLFSRPCKNIKKWPQTQWKVYDTSETVRPNDISSMTAQMKRGIEDEVNSLL